MKLNHMLVRIVLMVMIFCAAAWAQDTASLTGTVTDPSGAAVPNAQIAVKNAEHGINRTGTQQRQRRFSLRLFAHRLLRFDGDGARIQEIRSQGHHAGDRREGPGERRLWKSAAISTEVIVARLAKLRRWKPNRPTWAIPSRGKEISQLELNGRDFTQLVSLSPGVTNQSGQDEGGARRDHRGFQHQRRPHRIQQL